jgi:hypothetical protein
MSYGACGGELDDFFLSARKSGKTVPARCCVNGWLKIFHSFLFTTTTDDLPAGTIVSVAFVARDHGKIFTLLPAQPPTIFNHNIRTLLCRAFR